jgi:hypothetical protein
LNTLFGGVTDPDPTVADAATKATRLIANGFCRAGVLHPAFKYNFQLYHPKLKKTSSHLLILLVKTDVFLSNRKIKVKKLGFFG